MSLFTNKIKEHRMIRFGDGWTKFGSYAVWAQSGTHLIICCMPLKRTSIELGVGIKSWFFSLPISIVCLFPWPTMHSCAQSRPFHLLRCQAHHARFWRYHSPTHRQIKQDFCLHGGMDMQIDNGNMTAQLCGWYKVLGETKEGRQLASFLSLPKNIQLLIVQMCRKHSENWTTILEWAHKWFSLQREEDQLANSLLYHPDLTWIPQAHSTFTIHLPFPLLTLVLTLDVRRWEIFPNSLTHGVKRAVIQL